MTLSTPITLEEMRTRGLDDRVQEILMLIGRGHLPKHVLNEATFAELQVFGYGPPCECGERGLLAGETECRECADEAEA